MFLWFLCFYFKFYVFVAAGFVSVLCRNIADHTDPMNWILSPSLPPRKKTQNVNFISLLEHMKE